MHIETTQAIARRYLQAMAEGRTDEMHSLLAPGPRSDATTAELAADGADIRSLMIRSLRPTAVGEDRIVLHAVLDVGLEPEASGEWRNGENERWVELVHSQSGWRINSIDSSAIGDRPWQPVVTWTQAHVMEGQISFDVPNAWARRSNRWIWAPAPAGLPEIGVQWRETGAGWTPSRMISADAEVLNVDTVSLAWGPATRFTLEVPNRGADSTSSIYEQHVIVWQPPSHRAYGFFGRAESRDELRSLSFVLRRMSASAELDTVSSVSSRSGERR